MCPDWDRTFWCTGRHPSSPSQGRLFFWGFVCNSFSNKLVVPGRIFSLSSLLVYEAIFKYRTFSLGHSLILSKWMDIEKKRWWIFCLIALNFSVISRFVCVIPNLHVLVCNQIIRFFRLFQNVHYYINTASHEGCICLPDFIMIFSDAFKDFDFLRGTYRLAFVN